MELGDDFRAEAAGEVVPQDPTARLARIVVRGLPERIGRDLVGFAILGDDMHDRHATGAKIGEQRRRALDQRAAAVGRQRQRRDGGIEVAAVHVDSDDGGARGIEVDHDNARLIARARARMLA